MNAELADKAMEAAFVALEVGLTEENIAGTIRAN